MKQHRLAQSVLALGCFLLFALFQNCGRFGANGQTGANSGLSLPVPNSGSLALFAGQLGGAGNLNGAKSAARFNSPSAIASDSNGNLYVADSANHSIRMISVSGMVTNFAGTSGVPGSADGSGTTASFNSPSGVAVDANDNIFIADTGNNTIRKISAAGMVTTFVGTAGMQGSTDGVGAAARFNNPSGIAIDSNGNIYVADTGNSIIRMVTAAGLVSTVAGKAGTPGSANGSAATARFSSPSAVAVDSSSNVYVADSGNYNIRKITASGVVTTLAGKAGHQGYADGLGTVARFFTPFGVAVDSSGNVYVADYFNEVVRKVTPDGDVTTLAGSVLSFGWADGVGTTASFQSPMGLYVAASGDIYVADSGNDTVRMITAAGVVSTFAGAAAEWGSTDGPGSSASFDNPAGLLADANGNIFVADYYNDLIRKIGADGSVSTIAGSIGGSADGPASMASFQEPSAIALDPSGNLYVADSGNDSIREISTTGMVTTFAGTSGAPGSTDGTGSSARFCNPSGIASDSIGNMYVADSCNDSIRKITPAAVVTTFAGTSGVQGAADGLGSSASFNNPTMVTLDSNGNLYIADSGNNTIRKITAEGMVTTFAGTAGVQGSTDGLGSSASFNNPTMVTLDSNGNLYVADTGNSAIRKITPEGVVTTVVGEPGQQGILLGSLPASIFQPSGVAVFANTLYLSSSEAILQLPLP